VEAIFEEHDFNGVPVVDADKRLLGVITQWDLLKACAFDKTNWFPAIARQSASQVMTRKPQVVSPETPLMQALQKLVETRNKSLPVVQEDRVLGIIGRGDVLMALRKASLGVIPARLVSPELKGLLEPASLHEQS
jgi:CBS domain-containing protein